MQMCLIIFLKILWEDGSRIQMSAKEAEMTPAVLSLIKFLQLLN